MAKRRIGDLGGLNIGGSKMAGEFWTHEEEDVLRRLVKKGVGMDGIHRVLTSRTRAAIANKMDALDLKIRNYQTPAIDYKALELLDV